MKFVIAPDSYKESLSALEVGRAIALGVLTVFPEAECVVVPVADGGEGTTAALLDATGGQMHFATVTGPLETPVAAAFGVLGDGTTAVIEMASASGLAHVPVAERNPLITTTRGTGELIAAALALGVHRIILGIGGSATNDGGMGMLKVLGARFQGDDGADIGEGGGALARLARIDISGLDARLGACAIEVACDVDNPLIGPEGAAAVFGPQKGATPAMIEDLDRSLARYARVIARDLSIDVANIPGAGAAGGMGAAATAFFGATLRPGIDIVLDALDFETTLEGADFVITGEGRIDSQTLHGKTPLGVASRARAHGIPVFAIAGCLSEDAEVVLETGISAIFSVMRDTSTLEEALTHAAWNVQRIARNVAAVLQLGIRHGSLHPPAVKAVQGSGQEPLRP